jgi:hypothetical protein
VEGIIREHSQSSVFNSLANMKTELILEGKDNILTKLLILNGGQRRDRTADAGLFRALPMDLSGLESRNAIDTKDVRGAPI